jgi:hypothetical protein
MLWKTYEFSCPRCVAGCYFYSQKNRLTDTVSFWLCYNLNKHIFDRDFILELHPASWGVAVIGPPVWMNICGIVTSPWTCHQPGHISSRSYYQAIGITNRTPPWTHSLMHRVHFFFTPTSDFDHPMLLQPDVITGWWCVRYTLTNHPQVSITAWLSHLWVLFLKSWTVCIPRARRRVHKMTHLNERSKIKEMPVTVTVWRHRGYKFILHLSLIIISHPSLLLALGFFPLLPSASRRWRTREAPSVNTLPSQREVLCPATPKLHHRHHSDLCHHRGPHR